MKTEQMHQKMALSSMQRCDLLAIYNVDFLISITFPDMGVSDIGGSIFNLQEVLSYCLKESGHIIYKQTSLAVSNACTCLKGTLYGEGTLCMPTRNPIPVSSICCIHQIYRCSLIVPAYICMLQA